MDKFSELMKGMAITGSDHHPVASETPSEHPLCRAYNNLWGVCTDTHMSFVDGRVIITGTLISKPDKWMDLIYSRYLGGVEFRTYGYICLSDLLAQYGVWPVTITYNGQPAIELIHVEPYAMDRTAVEVTTPSKYSRLAGSPAIRECLKHHDPTAMVEAINQHPDIPGNHWHLFGNNLVGEVYGEICRISLNYQKGVRIQDNTITESLTNMGMDKANLYWFPQYLMMERDGKWSETRMIHGGIGKDNLDEINNILNSYGNRGIFRNLAGLDNHPMA